MPKQIYSSVHWTQTIEKMIKSVYNEYNSSRYLISAIIKNVSRNPICELNG